MLRPAAVAVAAVAVAAPVAAIVLATMTACPAEKSGGHSDGGTAAAKPEAPVTLTGVGPRSTSNETAQPLLLYGRGFAQKTAAAAPLRVRLGAPFAKDLPLVVDDDAHAHTVLPAGLLLPPDQAEVKASLTLEDDKGAAVGDAVDLVVVNDAGYDEFTGLVVSGHFAFTARTNADELVMLDLDTGKVASFAVGDGPWALAKDGDLVVVSFRYEPALAIVVPPGMVPAAASATPSVRKVPGPTFARALAVAGGTAYVGDFVDDSLWAIDLRDGTVQWKAPVGPNPGGIAVVADGKGAAPDKIAVGSLVDGETFLVSMKDGAVSKAIAPRPGVEILGGHTAGFGKMVMNGRGVRALASSKNGAVYSANSGPNVGPNPEHMGVSPTGGVGVIDAKALSYPRHLAFNFGVVQALLVDDAKGRLYAADVGEGLIHVVDTKVLAEKDGAKAVKAWLGSVTLPPPAGFPTFRPKEDFADDGLDINAEAAPPKVGENRERRAGVEVHTGPSALAWGDDAHKTILVLERFTGRVTQLDVTAGPLPKVVKSFELTSKESMLAQEDRRLGEVVYYADLGRTGMSCDVCHLDGGPEGVFFTKTGMERIWRSPTVRGTRDTPPYFNPPAHPTLADTVSYVGSNNRFQNPKMSVDEVRRLTAFSQSLTTWPNPFRKDDGGFKDELVLDGDRKGHPAKGRSIFEGRCAGCHPAPLYATDQDEKTRKRFMKLGTPAALDLRKDQQNLTFQHRTPPSLVGAWDVWPMLLSASAGFEVKDGDHLEAVDRSAVRAVLDRYSDRTHGDAMSLSPEARADLEAFILSL